MMINFKSSTAISVWDDGLETGYYLVSLIRAVACHNTIVAVLLSGSLSDIATWRPGPSCHGVPSCIIHQPQQSLLVDLGQ